MKYLVAHLILAVSFLPFITSSYAGVPFGDRSVPKIGNPGWTTVAYYGNYTPRIGNTTDACNPMPRVGNPDSTTDAYGNCTPRIGNSDWTTEPYGNPTPRVCKSDWTTEPYGNHMPRVGNPDWTTDAFGNPTPRVEPPHKNEIPFHPGC